MSEFATGLVDPARIGEFLGFARSASGLSLQQVAAEAGLPKSVVHKAEHGGDIRVSTASRIVRWLKTQENSSMQQPATNTPNATEIAAIPESDCECRWYGAPATGGLRQVQICPGHKALALLATPPARVATGPLPPVCGACHRPADECTCDAPAGT